MFRSSLGMWLKAKHVRLRYLLVEDPEAGVGEALGDEEEGLEETGIRAVVRAPR